MQSEFESKRELIYRLLKILGRMDIIKDSVVTTWVWDFQNDKPKRIK